MPKTRFSTELIGEFALTAGANDETSAEKRARVATQLRDRYGRWVDMGRGVKFKVRLPNGKYHNALGPFTGDMTPDGRGYIKVENDPYLPNGNYPVASKNAQQYIALLTDEDLAQQGIELGKDVDGNVVTAREDSSIPDLADLIAEGIVSGSPNKELRSSITGDEIQDIKISSIAKALKAEGRFPVPRQSSLDTWGKTSDATKGAKLDYAKVYEGMSSEDPEFAEKYPTFNSFWDRVVDLAVDERTQSPNDLNQINQEMKEINKGYAKHVLGLDPENGTFTVYRNAINNAFEEKDAAVGYVSTSKNLAFDYNAGTRAGEQANGRYEITVKPDEVNGMIGYSQVEDEYALTIGQGVTYQEGRVKKVGELETVKVAPWHEEAVGKLKRGQGATPFRGHSFVGQFDFLPISKNPMQVDKLQDFLDDNNMTMDDWKNKFDELHGEGAYQRFKDSGRENQVSLQSLERMFVDLGDGTYGLDITKLSPAGNDSAGSGSYGDAQNPSSFLNDYVDNKLKFLSLIQEITGEPFMVHKNNSRNKEVVEKVSPPEPEAEKISISELPNDTTDFDEEILSSDFDQIKFDIAKAPDAEESYALYQYQGPKYEDINKFARENPNYKESENDPLATRFAEETKTINKIDSAFKNIKIAEDVTVYRGAAISKSRYESLLTIKPGDKLVDSAYMSTSVSPKVAKGFAYGVFEDDKTKTPVIYKINVKAGQPAIRVRDYTTADDLGESEILLSRGASIKVTNVSKTTFDPLTEDGDSVEVLVIEGEYEPVTEITTTTEENPQYVPTKEDYKNFFDVKLEVQDFNESEKNSLWSYQHDDDFSSEGYRAQLRSGDWKGNKVLDSAISKSKLLEDVTLYRGLKVDEATYKTFLSKEVGQIEIDLGYMSTSHSENVAKNFSEAYGPGKKVLYKINMPAGSSAIKISDYTDDYEEELEFVLPRNTPLKISNIFEDPSTDTLMIESDYVQTQEPAPAEPSQWDGVPFDPKHMVDNNETSYFIREPNPPKTTYHVAPKSVREDVLKNGLDPKDLTHNTGLGAYGDDKFEDEHLWSKDDNGDYFAFEYRPIGVYMFDSLEEAQKYASENSDIYEIDTVSNNREIIRDPVSAANWDYLMDEEKSWVTRYVQPQSLKLIDNPKSSEPAKAEPDTIIVDGTNTITDRKGNTINSGEEVEISYAIYEVGKGSRNAEKPLKAIFTGYKESDFSAGKGIETKNRAILYVPAQEGTLAGYYGVSPYVLNADPNSDDFRGVGGTSPVDIDGFSEKNALPSPKQMTPLSEQEAESVIDYTNHKGSYVEINSSLRNESVSLETQEKIDVLDKIIGYNQILEDQDYYRGIPIPLGLTLKEFLTSLESGEIEELEETGFSSTSTDEKMASIFANKYFGGGVVLRIRAKAGQNAYYVPKFLAGVIANENEVILPRGLKYKIINYEFDPQEDKVLLNVEIG